MSFPDVIDLLRDHLLTLSGPDDIATRVPDPRPTRWWQIRRVGGTADTVRDRARVDVFTWHQTDEDAMADALVVRAGIWALSGTTLLGGVQCYRIEETLGPRQFDDPITGLPRVLATYVLHVRADAAIYLPSEGDDS